MLIIKDGQFDATHQTSMVKDGDLWKNLLVVQADHSLAKIDLSPLFNTDFVQDSDSGVKYWQTKFFRLEEDADHWFVWFFYNGMTTPTGELEAIVAEQDEVLNLLGVETEVVENAEN